MRRAVAMTLGSAVAAGVYLVLIDSVSLPELYAMAGIVLLAALAFAAAVDEGFTEAAVRGRWLLRAYRPVLQVPANVVLLAREVVGQLLHRRPSRGGFRAVSFAAGEEPHDIGRRALSEMLGSLAPNTIVIGVDTERQLLLVHQLHRTGSAEKLDVLSLGSEP